MSVCPKCVPGSIAAQQRVADIHFGLNLNTRIQNAFRSNDAFDDTVRRRVDRPIVTIADLVNMTEAEVARMPNIGLKAIAAIKQMLSEHGFRFCSGTSALCSLVAFVHGVVTCAMSTNTM